MRLYAFLVLALFALAARAATIPDNVSPFVEKKVDYIPEKLSSEQEIIDKANIINDVDNKLRTKPVETSPEVPPPTSAESEEIIRPAVDLRNPGHPQRQEHETQNPEFYSAEQNIVQTYKQNLNNAKQVFNQGIDVVSKGIQDIIDNNEQFHTVRESIQKLRVGFIDQINTLNGSVQSFLNGDKTNEVSPAKEQIKSNFKLIESGLNTIKNDFTEGVKTLVEGVESVKADNPVENKPSSGAAPAPATPPQNFLQNLITGFQNNVQTGFNNLTATFANFVNPGQNQQASAPAPAGAQADTPATSGGVIPAGGWGSGSGPLYQAWVSFNNAFQQYFSRPIQNIQGFIPSGQNGEQSAGQGNLASGTQPVSANGPVGVQQTGGVQQDETKPSAPAAQPQAVTPVGPIRQVLQNNPISQGIAATIQRLQNVNNPEKPRDSQEEPEVKGQEKGHSPGSGYNNNNSGIAEPVPAKEAQKKALPEGEAKAKKTEEVVNKTE